jgi:periplasmic protein CpxP/Spy
MKTWIRRTLFGLLGTAALVGGLSACGTRGHERHGGWSDERVTEMRGKAIERIGSKLDLNDAQKQKLGVLADELIAQRKALRGDGSDPRSQMQGLIAGTTFDRAGAQRLVDQKTQTVQAGAPRVIAAMADFYDSLTPEQQAKVRERMAEGRRWGRGWGRG